MNIFCPRLICSVGRLLKVVNYDLATAADDTFENLKHKSLKIIFNFCRELILPLTSQRL